MKMFIILVKLRMLSRTKKFKLLSLTAMMTALLSWSPWVCLEASVYYPSQPNLMASQPSSTFPYTYPPFSPNPQNQMEPYGYSSTMTSPSMPQYGQNYQQPYETYNNPYGQAAQSVYPSPTPNALSSTQTDNNTQKTPSMIVVPYPFTFPMSGQGGGISPYRPSREQYPYERSQSSSYSRIRQRHNDPFAQSIIEEYGDRPGEPFSNQSREDWINTLPEGESSYQPEFSYNPSTDQALDQLDTSLKSKNNDKETLQQSSKSTGTGAPSQVAVSCPSEQDSGTKCLPGQVQQNTADIRTLGSVLDRHLGDHLRFRDQSQSIEENKVANQQNMYFNEQNKLFNEDNRRIIEQLQMEIGRLGAMTQSLEAQLQAPDSSLPFIKRNHHYIKLNIQAIEESRQQLIALYNRFQALEKDIYPRLEEAFAGNRRILNILNQVLQPTDVNPLVHKLIDRISILEQQIYKIKKDNKKYKNTQSMSMSQQQKPMPTPTPQQQHPMPMLQSQSTPQDGDFDLVRGVIAQLQQKIDDLQQKVDNLIRGFEIKIKGIAYDVVKEELKKLNLSGQIENQPLPSFQQNSDMSNLSSEQLSKIMDEVGKLKERIARLENKPHSPFEYGSGSQPTLPPPPEFDNEDDIGIPVSHPHGDEQSHDINMGALKEILERLDKLEANQSETPEQHPPFDDSSIWAAIDEIHTAIDTLKNTKVEVPVTTPSGETATIDIQAITQKIQTNLENHLQNLFETYAHNQSGVTPEMVDDRITKLLDSFKEEVKSYVENRLRENTPSNSPEDLPVSVDTSLNEKIQSLGNELNGKINDLRELVERMKQERPMQEETITSGVTPEMVDARIADLLKAFKEEIRNYVETQLQGKNSSEPSGSSTPSPSIDTSMIDAKIQDLAHELKAEINDLRQSIEKMKPETPNQESIPNQNNGVTPEMVDEHISKILTAFKEEIRHFVEDQVKQKESIAPLEILTPPPSSPEEEKKLYSLVNELRTELNDLRVMIENSIQNDESIKEKIKAFINIELTPWIQSSMTSLDDRINKMAETLTDHENRLQALESMVKDLRDRILSPLSNVTPSPMPLPTNEPEQEMISPSSPSSLPEENSESINDWKEKIVAQCQQEAEELTAQKLCPQLYGAQSEGGFTQTQCYDRSRMGNSLDAVLASQTQAFFVACKQERLEKSLTLPKPEERFQWQTVRSPSYTEFINQKQKRQQDIGSTRRKISIPEVFRNQ